MFWGGREVCVQGRVAQLERRRCTSGLVVVRDFLDKGEHYFSMTQLQETGFHPASSQFPSYLLFHSTDLCQTWYPRKALIKENPTAQITRYGDEFPSRTSAITGTASLGSNSRYYCLPNRVPFLLTIAPRSTNVFLRFCSDLEGLGYVLGVEIRVSLVGFTGNEEFWVGMGLQDGNLRM